MYSLTFGINGTLGGDENVVIQSDTLKIKLDSLVKATEALYYQKKHKQVLKKTDSIAKVFKAKNQADSLNIAKLYYFQFESYYALGKYQSSIKSTNKGLSFCSNQDIFKQTKAILYYKRAYAEGDLGFSLKSYKSMQESAYVLESQKVPNTDYLVGSYLYLSSEEADHGNLEEAERYLRLAEKAYKKDKIATDKARQGENGENNRYEVMLPYRNSYLLYELGQTETDSIKLENQVQKLTHLKSQPEFSVKHESIYYTTGLNHAANWLISRSEKYNNKSKNLKRANLLLDKAIYAVEKKGFKGLLVNLKYNKCKALTLNNELKKAEILINSLLADLSSKDGRRPYFLAQKGLIKAKKKEKDGALAIFRKSIELANKSEEKLAEDYHNFVPNTSFGTTNLIVRIAEKLTEFYPKDEQVQNTIANLYTIALIQFKNSTINSTFSPSYDAILRKIIRGTLLYPKQGNGYNDFLEKTEILKNQLAWKRFNQNRFTNNLSALDSIKSIGLQLRNELVIAKKNKNLQQQDSLAQRIHKNERNIENKYPNLKLLSEAKFSIKKLQNKLKSDELVLKYIVLQDKIAIYRITKTAVNVELKPWSRTEKERLETFVTNLKSQKYDRIIAKELTKLLIPNDLKYKSLIINPDSELFKLPFEILVVNDSYLIEQFNVRYSSNLGFIEPDVLKTKSNDKLAVYIPDYDNKYKVSTTRGNLGKLIGAQKEAYAISQYFKTDIYDNVDLNKQDFINTAKNARLLHLAMHSDINNKQPELSKLLFGTSKNANDDLYLEEIYGMNLNADLVVLSACNTGVGKENAGKSLESFQRAFTFAGVPATVASLWEVPDLATKQIMESFYKKLKSGKTKSEALRLAKLSYLKEHKGTKNENPYYWAGFVIYGSDKEVANQSSNIVVYLFTFAALICLIFLIFKLKKVLLVRIK